MSDLHEDDHGRYMKVNGREVYLTSRSHRSSESDSIRAVKSNSDSSHSRSPPTSVSSFPERYRESTESRHSRKGRSDAVYGEQSGRNSDPGLSSGDYYRERIASTPPRRGTNFRDRYEDYKDKDAVAMGKEDNYKDFSKSAGRYSRREREKSPGTFTGQPLETRDWHGKAWGYAERASSAYAE